MPAPLVSEVKGDRSALHYTFDIVPELGGGRKVSARAAAWFLSEIESLKEALCFSSCCTYTCNETEAKCLAPLSLPSRGENGGDGK